MIASLEIQVIEGRFAEAETTTEAIIAAFGCGPLADPALVARLWLAEAVVLSAHGEREASDDALAAAARVSPTWNELYGPALKRRWDEASRLPAGAPGRLRLEPLPQGYIGAIDGNVLPLPASLPPGLHLLQVGQDPSAMSTALRFDLPAGLDLVLDAKLPVLPVAPVPVAPVPVAPVPVSPVPGSPGQKVASGLSPRDRRILHALAVGGASALAYGVTFATHSAFYRAPLSQRHELRVVNNGLVIAAMGGGLTSSVLLMRGMTMPTPAGAASSDR